MLLVEKKYLYLSIVTSILIIVGLALFMSSPIKSPNSEDSLIQENEYFIGLVTNPDFLAHGDVINIKDYSCYESDVAGGVEMYYLYGDAILSKPINTQDDYKTAIVRSGINKNNVDELVTTVDSPELGMRFPPAIKCNHVEKEIPGVSFYKKTAGIASVKYNNLCGDGEPLLPNVLTSYYHNGVLKVTTTISLSYSGENLILERTSQDSHGNDYPYFSSYKDRIEQQAKEKPISFTVSCINTPALNNSKA